MNQSTIPIKFPLHEWFGKRIGTYRGIPVFQAMAFCINIKPDKKTGCRRIHTCGMAPGRYVHPIPFKVTEMRPAPVKPSYPYTKRQARMGMTNDQLHERSVAGGHLGAAKRMLERMSGKRVCRHQKN